MTETMRWPQDPIYDRSAMAVRAVSDVLLDIASDRACAQSYLAGSERVARLEQLHERLRAILDPLVAEQDAIANALNESTR